MQQNGEKTLRNHCITRPKPAKKADKIKKQLLDCKKLNCSALP
jgi:hypothetical protein